MKFSINLRRASPYLGNTAVDPARRLQMSVLAATLNRLDDATDGQLLGRFVQSCDADAFAALVRRLGPTVLAVCRRVCPDAHLAEDAFQAAFLVLARKADTVRPREQVAVWLHGVAYRTASKARAMLANRRRREVGSSDLPEPPAPDATLPDDELQKLDAAIAGLPDHLRAAVVLCELEGRSRKDAAKQLGIPEGTLSSRLAEARKRLGEHLRPTVAAVVTATLAARTAEAVVSGSTSETVRSLAHGVMSMLLLNKLKLPAVVAVLLTATVLTVPLLTPAHSAPVPKSLKQPVGGIGVTKGGVLYLLAPDGTATHEFDVEDKWDLEWLEGPCRVHTSPTGFPVAVVVPRGSGNKVNDAGGDSRYELRLIRSADDVKGERVKVEDQLTGELVWSRSGKRFYVGTRKEVTSHTKYLAIDPTTGRATSSVVPEGHTLVAELADGTLVTDSSRSKVRVLAGKQIPLPWELHTVSADGKTVTELTPCPHNTDEHPYDLSPDGKTLLSWRFDKVAGTDVLFTFDLVTGKMADIKPQARSRALIEVRQVKWSPDGKRVAFVYSPRVPPWSDNPDSTLHMCDHNGSNGKDLFIWKAHGDTFNEVGDAHFEWN